MVEEGCGDGEGEEGRVTWVVGEMGMHCDGLWSLNQQPLNSEQSAICGAKMTQLTSS